MVKWLYRPCLPSFNWWGDPISILFIAVKTNPKQVATATILQCYISNIQQTITVYIYICVYNIDIL